MSLKPNRLINEKSPYLLQHAYNPVDWYPWCNEAFEKAKLEDKPIFLSIGYSTCHWCHVMEKESFEDEEVAKILNNNFICIKVDREERPDVDAFYMDVCQILTGKGGWPLSIFMTPEKHPFYAGTYLPKESFGNYIGIKDLARAIAYYWQNKREEIHNSTEKVISLLKEDLYKNGPILNKEIFKKTFFELIKTFDNEYGGFGISPKFPPYNNLFFLIRYYQMTDSVEALDMLKNTLNAICTGGIYDFISGGIHRYSTDRFWKLPHFEKMLYDQALMSIILAKSYVLTGADFYKEKAEEIVNYCINYLKNVEGGFFCGEDADSEGEEGKFYLWEEKELEKALGKEDFIDFKKIFNIQSDGNFEEELTGHLSGKNILFINKEFSQRYLIDLTFRQYLKGILSKLSEIRDKRIRPAKDEKILLDWNCLMISAICNVYRITGNQDYKKIIFETISFIEKNFIKENDKLFHSYFKGKVDISGFLEDYAFLVWAYIELYKTFFEKEWIKKAIKLQEKTNELFWDYNKYGFFHTSITNTEIPIRQKILVDSVMPSGNSVSFNNLLTLWIITEDPSYEDLAKKMLLVFSSSIEDLPVAYTYFIYSFSYFFDFPGKVKISGRFDKEFLYPEIHKLSTIDWVIEIIENDNDLEAIICKDKTCSEKINGLETIKNYLKKLINSTIHI